MQKWEDGIGRDETRVRAEINSLLVGMTVGITFPKQINKMEHSLLHTTFQLYEAVDVILSSYVHRWLIGLLGALEGVSRRRRLDFDPCNIPLSIPSDVPNVTAHAKTGRECGNPKQYMTPFALPTCSFKKLKLK